MHVDANSAATQAVVSHPCASHCAATAACYAHMTTNHLPTLVVVTLGAHQLGGAQLTVPAAKVNNTVGVLACHGPRPSTSKSIGPRDNTGRTDKQV